MTQPAFVKKVVETMTRHRMMSGGHAVVVGVSGGPDSVCLLHVLQRLSRRWDLTLHVAHLNHQFRGEEAREDALFVRRLSEEMGIHATIESFDVPAYAGKLRLNRQEAAREVRYDFLHRVAASLGAQRIAVGHTADDQAETVLMRLLRGGGLRGLSGIFPLKEGMIIRPLLEVRRSEIVHYLEEEKLPYRHDSTNFSPVSLRNKVRLSLLPLLARDYNPRIRETLAREAESQREAAEFLHQYAEKILPVLVKDKERQRLSLDAPGLSSLPPIVQREVIREAAEEVAGETIRWSSLHLSQAVALIAKGKTGQQCAFPKGIRLEKSYNTLRIVQSPPHKEKDTSFPLRIPGSVAIPSFHIVIRTEVVEGSHPCYERETASFDYDTLSSPLAVRNRRAGDLFYPSGMGGKRKKLQDYFVDLKIPSEKRGAIPLLVSAEGLLWVMGWRTDERFEVTEKTRRTLIVTMKKEG